MLYEVITIEYASKIQSSILPSADEIDKYLNAFIMYKPKEIVSGDFYWFTKIPEEDKILIAVGDCTGHGVPGALMSMIGATTLNEIIIHKQTYSPKEILAKLKKTIINLLNQDKTQNNFDGMDIAICQIDLKSNEVRNNFV